MPKLGVHKNGRERQTCYCLSSRTVDFRGERGRNRTFNLLIKSQLLCQLSYAPALEDYCDYSIPRRFVTRIAQVLRGAPPPLVARCPAVSEASRRRTRPGRRGTWSGRTDRPFQWSARRSRSALLRARY